MPARTRTPTIPRGLLSTLACAWLAIVLTAGIWVMAGIGPGLLAAGVLGGLALVAADQLVTTAPAPRGRP